MLLTQISKIIRQNKPVAKQSKSDLSSFVFYKLVDATMQNNIPYYTLQCINTKATIKLTLFEIIDYSLVQYLHPIQACLIGIEYSLQQQKHPIPPDRQQIKKLSYLQYRYGNNHLQYLDRRRNMHFTNAASKKQYCAPATQIAFTETLIEEFDSSQAFYIGINAGITLNTKNSKTSTYKKPILCLVRSDASYET